MAKLLENRKGFLIIEMSVEEATDKCSFGFEDADTGDKYIVCDNCTELFENIPNKSPKDEDDEDNKIYYIAVVNRAVCRRCCLNFIGTMTRYKQDYEYEKSHYNYYANILGIELK